MDEAHYESFYHCIEEKLKDVTLQATTSVLLIDEYDISVANIESLALLEPFGMANEEPIFLLKNAPIVQVYQLSQGKHLKLDIQFSNIKLSALFFQHGDMYEQLKNQKTVDLVGTLQINEFRNQRNINFMIKDII